MQNLEVGICSVSEYECIYIDNKHAMNNIGLVLTIVNLVIAQIIALCNDESIPIRRISINPLREKYEELIDFRRISLAKVKSRSGKVENQ